MRSYSSYNINSELHPELEPGENFLTNCEPEDVPKLREKYPNYDLRVGKIAYCYDGKPLATVSVRCKNAIPVFWKPKEA